MEFLINCTSYWFTTYLYDALQGDWPQPQPAIGRLANFSSLRKHRPKEYSIYDAYFGNLNCYVNDE